jgi:hypothetical protein
MSAATATLSMFQTNTIAALVPADARKKRHVRAVLQAFAEQFGQALTSRLQVYAAMQKVKTVTAETLRTAAEELLGAGAASVPQGIDEASLPTTMVVLRFRRSLGGLRLESSCARIVGIVGFNFLRYVQDILERVYGAGEEAKNVDVSAVIAALERPNIFSATGMPCIVYRHDASMFGEDGEIKAAAPAAAPKAAETAATEEPKAEETKKAKGGKGKKAKAAEAQAPAVEAPKVVEAAAAEAPKAKGGKGKKRERKEETAEAAAPVVAKQIEETPAVAAKKPRARKTKAAEATATA